MDYLLRYVYQLRESKTYNVFQLRVFLRNSKVERHLKDIRDFRQTTHVRSCQAQLQHVQLYRQ
jgi:hypothetical protein